MIKLADISKELVIFTKSKSKAVYEKSEYLPAYVISNLTVSQNVTSGRSSILEVSFDLI